MVVLNISASSPPIRLSESELDELVAAFDQQRLPKTAWTQAAHLRVGCCCVLARGETAAVDQLRRGIRMLNESHGVRNSDSNGFHETLTRFWAALLARTLQEYAVLQPCRSRADAVQAAVELYYDRACIVDDFWTFDVIRSTQCRHEWHPPDAAPLDVAVLPCTAERFAREVRGWTDISVVMASHLPPAGAGFLARRSGLSVGCIATRILAPGVGEVVSLCVVTPHRRVGIGRLLLGAAMA
jgi:ribosomal protein S18 acetylase RimI-like enzyme